MKRIIIIITLKCLLFTLLLQGMENNNKTIFVRNKSKITVTKNSIVTASGKVDAIIVGRNGQEKLEKNGNWISKLNCIQYRDSLYIKNKETESASDDDSWNPITIDNNEILIKEWKKAHEEKMESIVMTISEPCIWRSKYYCYDKSKKEFIQDYYYIKKEMNEKGDRAVQEALKDLDECYKVAFEEISHRLSDKEIKRIAIALLGVDVGFPRKEAVSVALKAIFELVKNNSEIYDIELFVKKRSEYALCKEFLQEPKI